MWKTNNLGTFPAEIPVRVFPTRRWKLQGHPRNREATGLGDRAALRMYRPICKQSNLDSPGNIIFLRYLLSRQFTSSLPPPPPLPHFLVYVIRPDATVFIFMRQVIVVIKTRKCASPRKYCDPIFLHADNNN